MEIGMKCLFDLTAPVGTQRPMLGRFYAGAGGVYIGRDLECRNIAVALSAVPGRPVGKLVQNVQAAQEYVQRLRQEDDFNYQLPTASELELIFRHASALVGVDTSNAHAERWCLVRSESGEHYSKADLYSGNEAAIVPGEWLCVFAIQRIWVR